MAFDAMEVLGKNGVLVLSSVTGGSRTVEVRADAINLGFVLGNKVVVGTVNARREHYEAAVRDMALAESLYPGWLSRLVECAERNQAAYVSPVILLHGTSPQRVHCAGGVNRIEQAGGHHQLSFKSGSGMNRQKLPDSRHRILHTTSPS